MQPELVRSSRHCIVDVMVVVLLLVLALHDLCSLSTTAPF
jgi:hypothetical protein